MATMASDWRPRLWELVDILIRVPPVFLMDSILALWSGQETAEAKTEEAAFEVGFGAALWFIMYSTLFLFSFVAFILETRQLLQLYMFLSSVGVLLWSYVCNQEFAKATIALTEKNTNLLYECFTLNSQVWMQTMGNYMLQVFLAIIFSFASSSPSSNNHNPSKLFSLWIIFIGPTFFSLFSPFIPNNFISVAPLLSALAAHAILVYGALSNIQATCVLAKGTFIWAKLVVSNEGVFALLKSQWRRLHVPQVLRLFWISRMAEQAAMIVADAHSNGMLVNWVQLSTDLLVRGCETTVSVMGMTSLVSVISHYICYSMKLFLQMEDADERNMGTVSAILFFVLAMQSGLTGMNPEKRLNRLYQNACLLMTAILHFFHSMINSLLQMLGASLNSPREKHIRALIVCAFLIVFPLAFLYMVWSWHNVSTWLLALSCFSTEVIVKVLVSLVVYILFLIDARLDSSWEPFDDYVYTVRAFGSCMELLFGIFLLVNGTWIFFFESGGTIRAFTILFHAYFNVWTQAKQGWANSVRRREAGKRLADFRRATTEQLQSLDDVCAICHHEMESAIVTDCDHYYHVNCLRRWLFLQNHCPLCHADFDQHRRAREENHEDERERMLRMRMRGLFQPPQPQHEVPEIAQVIQFQPAQAHRDQPHPDHPHQE